MTPFYQFDADDYCESCGKDICQRVLRETGKSEEDFEDERTYDSSEYPKTGLCEQEEVDSPHHCGSGEDCLEAIEVEEGWKVGALLPFELTSDGVEYLKEAIEGGGPVAELWADHYSEYL